MRCSVTHRRRAPTNRRTDEGDGPSPRPGSTWSIVMTMALVAGIVLYAIFMVILWGAVRFAG